MIDKVFQKISDIIKSDFKNSFTGGQVEIQDSTSKPVKINKTGPILCLQLDKKNSNIFPFFESSVLDLCKISDRIIVYPTAKSIFVFNIELKSTNTTGAIEQVRASYELSKFICNTARRLLHYPKVEINYRGIIFSHKVYKGTTKPKNLGYTDDLKSELKYKHVQSGQSIDLDVFTY